MSTTRERDNLWCKVLLSTLPLNYAVDVLREFNARRPDPVSFYYYCTKCGYAGLAGPEHSQCNYLAGEIGDKSIPANAQANLPPERDARREPLRRKP